ncbi:Cytochrome P450 9e2 [Habropoda laboriosa]|uniref:Cytochrome P450 9e2 n=1 Tax=Habropoda laboriosa TaxID=597456 RepID=A0A0L7QR59_9HYME|nr:PREDICTED: cytochrome P450 9e2-like [Habropoda laboriosa]KOC61113.1 Cytochrome P450 9e2 [Habropoda laboriosa]
MDYLPIVLALFAVFLAVYYYNKRAHSVFKDVLHVPPTPIVGNFGSLITKRATLQEVLQKSYDLHPDAKYVGFYEFLSSNILVRDPELFKSIAVKNFDNFSDHRKFTDKRTDPLFAGMLFQLAGNEWKEQRNMLSPTFTSSKIKNMFKLMSDCAMRFSTKLSNLQEKEREVEVRNLFARYTNDVIAKCVYGVSVDTMEEPKNIFYVYGRAATLLTGLLNTIKFMLYRNLPELAVALRLNFVKKRHADFFSDVVRKTIESRESSGVKGTDMLQLMMDIRDRKDSSKRMSIKDIICHAFTFFFGGFDTVSSQSAFIAHMLAENPEAQTRLQEEIDEALERTNGQLTYETINEMKYLDAVVNETLRLYPIVVFLDRVCTRAFELPPALPGGKPFVVQPGTNIWLPVYSIHRDPKYYENPDKFDPERFLVDGKKILNSGVYMPFGSGPRMCIGNRFALTEMKVLIYHLLSKCDIKAGQKTTLPMQLEKGVLNVTAKNNEFWLKMEPRKNPHPSVLANGVSNGVANGIANGVCKQ